MADHITKKQRSWNMGRIHSSHTKPELIIRSLLHRHGFRFRLNYSKLPGSPDIVLPKYKTVIFVHGCFWHRHPNCSKATTPKTNRGYWQNKFYKNVSRDIDIRKKLQKLEWDIIVLWECEIMNDPIALLDYIIKELGNDTYHKFPQEIDRGEIMKIAEKRSDYYLNAKNNSTKIFRLGEFFCGPGGLALGAKMAKVEQNKVNYLFKHAWATDYDQDSCETYRMNICRETPNSVIREDIRHLDFNKLKKISDIDGFSFGFPCNDFSVVGEKKGINGIYGPLYTYGVMAIQLFKPEFFLAENVGGLRNSNDGKVFAKILKELFDSGYSIYPHLYSFDKYGVPQARQRIIIIGIRNDLGPVDIHFNQRQMAATSTKDKYDEANLS